MLRPLFQIQPSLTALHSARSYVPIVIFSRALAALRIFLIAKILGTAGQREFGLYQPALEFINWIVPLVLLGLADVIERYAAQLQLHQQLLHQLKRHFTRLISIGLLAILVLLALSPFIAHGIFRLPSFDHQRPYGILLVAGCSVTTLLLALDIYLMSLLRGLRAFSAAAGMEFTASLILFILSLAAAFITPIAALALLFAYALSLLIPILYYTALLVRHLKSQPAVAPSEFTIHHSQFTIFARWSFLRLLMFTSFNLASIWSVGFLESHAATGEADPHGATAAYAMPYRIAQLLAWFAITLWSSVYGIAAKNYAHQQTRRAKVQLFRVGKFGAALLTLLALFLLLIRPLIAHFFPIYAEPINQLLPPMLALFIWYSLLAFATTYADLQEKPHISAILWAAALATQLAVIFLPNHSSFVLSHLSLPQALQASIAGILVALALVPFLLGRPFKLTATFVPLALLALVPFALLAPSWIVNLLAPAVILPAILFLQFAGLLFRRVDRRSLRKFRSRNAQHL